MQPAAAASWGRPAGPRTHAPTEGRWGARCHRPSQPTSGTLNYQGCWSRSHFLCQPLISRVLSLLFFFFITGLNGPEDVQNWVFTSRSPKRILRWGISFICLFIYWQIFIKCLLYTWHCTWWPGGSCTCVSSCTSWDLDSICLTSPCSLRRSCNMQTSQWCKQEMISAQRKLPGSWEMKELVWQSTGGIFCLKAELLCYFFF